MSTEDQKSDPRAAKDAMPATITANAEMAANLPFGDTRDFEDARRGFIGTVPDGIITSARGSAVWNLTDYQFLEPEQAPDTVNPSLWRQARLNLNNGLFRVTDRVYQIRGLDLSNMTIIEGDSGLIIIDPVTTAETSRAGLDLYYAHRPERPIKAVIYSHSHMDHYGGVKGIIDEADVAADKIQIWAPDGFMAAVTGENVLAGSPMGRRAQYQFGPLLKKGPRGQVDAGLGKVIPRGRVGLIAPTRVVVEETERHLLDGVEVHFQLAPESEAPAEMHMFFPQFKVLNMAENACHNLHNFCPLRGSVVRDPRMWAHYLNQAIELFGADCDILINQHHWPTWGRDRIIDYLGKQRDVYKYIHDQTVRLMNHGQTPAEIAEAIDLPQALQGEWAVRGYYGTVNHNSKAVYQRYLSWYDGNPANLHPLPAVPTAKKTISYMGGADAVLSRARTDFEAGEFRWVVQVTSQLVFAEPENQDAALLLADAFEQLGYQAESATWRNAYLYGAQELRHGILKLPPRPLLPPDLLEAVDISGLFDLMAVRLNPVKVAGRSFVINWQLADGTKSALRLRHDTLTHVLDKQDDDAKLTVHCRRADLVALTLKRDGLAEMIADGTITTTGDPEPLTALLAMLDDFPFMFPLVTPSSSQ